MANICWKCIDDTHLSSEVREEGERLKCSECSTYRLCVSVERFGELIEPSLRDAIQPGPEHRVFDGMDDDRGHFEQKGDDLDGMLQDYLGQYFSFQEELIDAVCAADHWDPRDGDSPYFDRDINYVATRSSVGEFAEQWHSLQYQLKHKQRFFNRAAHQYFSDIFGSLDGLRVWNETTRTRTDPVVVKLPQGSALFRARISKSADQIVDMLRDPLASIGPPPQQLAKAGRMNAEGVTVLYAAMDIETCLAEMRPSIGSSTCAIALLTSRVLRLLDFSLLEASFPEQGVSIFDPKHRQQSERLAFLRQLHYLISLPVTPGNEADYTITQSMTEFLCYSLSPGIDGFMFRSVQKEGGTNVVLFPNEAGERFPVTYLDESLQVFVTQEIAYGHRKMKTVLTTEGKCLLWDPDAEPGDDYD